MIKKIGHYLWPLVTVLLVILYYKLNWGSFSNGVVKVDHQSEFLYDFIYHYYPMGKKIFEFEQLSPGYYYTSFFAILISPICILNLPLAVHVWAGFQLILVLLYAIIAKALINISYRTYVLYALLLTISYPILNNLKWGQVSILLTVLMLASFFFARKDKNLVGGLLLAMAVAIKYYPIILIVYFISKRKYSFCISFSVSVVLFYFLMPAIILGFADWFKFESTSIQALSNNAGLRQDINSQYFLHVTLRLIDAYSTNSLSSLHAKIIEWVGYIIAGLCFMMMWIFKSNEVTDRYCISIIPIFLAIPFLVKSSWPHYFVYLPFCQLITLNYLINSLKELKKIGMTGVLITIIFILFSSVFVFDFFGHWSFFNKNGMLFFANLLLVIVMLLILTKNNMQLFLKKKQNGMIFK